MRFLLFLAILAIGIAHGSLYFAEDITGDGSFWTSTDHSSTHDRAGGDGEWAYGHIVSPGSLISLYSFDGSNGWYTIGYKDYNLSHYMQATALTAFNASSQINDNQSTIELSGSGRLKMVALVPDSKGHPTDLSRSFISGKFVINRSTIAW